MRLKLICFQSHDLATILLFIIGVPLFLIKNRVKLTAGRSEAIQTSSPMSSQKTNLPNAEPQVYRKKATIFPAAGPQPGQMYNI